MLRCSSCATEVVEGIRFCPQCGARMPEVSSSGQGEQAPIAGLSGQPAVQPTIVLGPNATSPTVRLTDGPSPTPVVSTSAQPTEHLPSLPSSSSAGQPTALYTAPPSGGQNDYGTGVPSYSPGTAQVSRAGGGRLWIVLGVIAGLGFLAVIGLVIGALLLVRSSSQTSSTGSTAAATAVIGSGARPTFGPPPTAVADGNAVDGAVVFQDSFDNPRRSDFTEETTENATYRFEDDGTYAINLKTAKYIVWSPFGKSYDDAAVDVESTLTDGPSDSAAGLIFHYQDEDNFYLFSVSGDGHYGLDVYDKGELNTLIDWTAAETIKSRGEMNVLRVETRGDLIRLFVNDTLLDEISDDTITKGQMALAVNTFDEGDAIVKFDNLVVHRLK